MLLQSTERLAAPDTVYLAQQWGSVSDVVVAACTLALTATAIVQGILLWRQIRLQSSQTSSGISQTATMQRQEALMRSTRDEMLQSGKAQAEATAKQLEIMRAQQLELSQQVELDRRKFIATYPPSLSMTPPIVDKTDPPLNEELDTRLILRFSVMNNGQSNARKIRIFCSSYWMIDRQRPNALTQSELKGPKRLAPTKRSELTHTSTEFGFLLALNDRTRDASSNVIVEVVAWFKDDTGRSHTSTAHFIFNTKTNAFQHSASGQLKFPRLGE